MPSSFTLPEHGRLNTILAPAADAAGRTGTAFSLKHAHKAYIICHINQGNAATIALTPQQCSAVAGTGAKAIPASPLWIDEDVATADALTKQTDAASYTTGAGTTVKRVIFEIDPAKLDVAGGFDCIRCNTGPSNVANITEISLLIIPGRYAQATPPSAAAD